MAYIKTSYIDDSACLNKSFVSPDDSFTGQYESFVGPIWAYISARKTKRILHKIFIKSTKMQKMVINTQYKNA